MYCYSCGNSLNVGANFCGHCGSQVSNVGGMNENNIATKAALNAKTISLGLAAISTSIIAIAELIGLAVGINTAIVIADIIALMLSVMSYVMSKAYKYVFDLVSKIVKGMWSFGRSIGVIGIILAIFGIAYVLDFLLVVILALPILFVFLYYRKQ